MMIKTPLKQKKVKENRELEVLRSGLEDSLEILQEGGRLVAISYHSLEDRIVKNFFKSGNFEGTIKKDFYGNPLVPLRQVEKGIIRPDDDEVEENPASRSARMRIAEKVKVAEDTV